jgi:hypothetical protein
MLLLPALAATHFSLLAGSPPSGKKHFNALSD